ncbi:MAG: hypothetical protein OEV72_04120, partial [Thermoleophilia bacterium]|nr:hypothetical protein [Thermoleophilia bacterium]
MTRPPCPVPGTAFGSTPCSAAIRATTGETKVRPFPPSPDGAATCGASGGTGDATGAAAGAATGSAATGSAAGSLAAAGASAATGAAG